MHWLDVISSLVDERAIIESSAIALGSSFAALFYYLFRRADSRARKVEDAPEICIDNYLLGIVGEAPFSCLPYVALNGRVVTFDEPLTSIAERSIRGVVLKKTTTEHKDVWQKYTQTWQSTDREISSISENISFSIEGENRHTTVKVIDPMTSVWFEDTLEVVHENFTPTTSNVMENIVGFVSGDRLKGFTVREKMLRLGSNLLAVGELVGDGNTLKLRPPTGENGDYIITKLSQREVVSKMKGKATFWKIMFILFGAASLTAVYFVVCRLRKKYIELKDAQRECDEMNEIRNQRTALAGRLNRNDPGSEDQGSCIICLTNPRECVLLDCGHICICVDCLEALPLPKECPMCRSRIKRTVPLYNA